jgi:hypothetical protein
MSAAVDDPLDWGSPPPIDTAESLSHDPPDLEGEIVTEDGLDWGDPPPSDPCDADDREMVVDNNGTVTGTEDMVGMDDDRGAISAPSGQGGGEIDVPRAGDGEELVLYDSHLDTMSMDELAEWEDHKQREHRWVKIARLRHDRDRCSEVMRLGRKALAQVESLIRLTKRKAVAEQQ